VRGFAFLAPLPALPVPLAPVGRNVCTREGCIFACVHFNAVVRLFSFNETWRRTLRPVVLTAVALALAGPAQAHDYSADIICRVTEIDGNQSAWSFAPNTTSVDGSPVSTFIETSYLGHGKSVVSQAGSRPVWVLTPNQLGGMTLLPRNDPGWSLVVSNLADTRRCSTTAF
jgi:hypothetical protein